MGPVAGTRDAPQGAGGDAWFITYGTAEVERRHRDPRSRLYMPGGSDLPVSTDRLGPTRTTMLTTAWGTEVIITDDWRIEGEVCPAYGYGEWTGSTYFELLPDEDGDEEANGSGRDEGPDEEEPEGEDENREGHEEEAEGTTSSRGMRHGRAETWRGGGSTPPLEVR